jgi:hypothetical protein
MAKTNKKAIKTITRCLFCIKDHRGKAPKLCRAKAQSDG